MKWLRFRLAYFAGKEALQKERWEKAGTEFEKALDVSPFHPAAVLGLAEATWKQNKMEEACALLQELLQREPDLAPAHFLLGIYLRKWGALPESLKELERSVSLDPKSAEAWQELGRARLLLKREKEALAAFREAAGIDPYLARLLFLELEEKAGSG